MVATRLQMNSSTAHRFLLSLEAAGALRSTRRGYFALGSGLATLARLAEESNPIVKRVEQEIATLSRELNESIMACTLTNEGLCCVAVSTCDRPISVNIKIGTVLPVLTSAQGKLWLAELSGPERKTRMHYFNELQQPKVKSNRLRELTMEIETASQCGYATNLGDNEPDIAAVSVPIHNTTGRMVLSLSVFGMLSRFDAKMIERARTQLQKISARVAV